MARKVVDLSIDFDFFSRELIRWDWGHGETSDQVFMTTAWQTRYSLLDVHDETSLKHADFPPLDVLSVLGAKGIRLGTREEINVGARKSYMKALETKKTSGRRIGLADSHKFAFDFLTDRRVAADVLLSIDAHHDLYSTRRLDCGNWLYHYGKKRSKTEIRVLYPYWKLKEVPREKDQSEKLPNVSHGMFRHLKVPAGDEWVLRDIFLCRSSAWLPPHHDEAFLQLAQGLCNFGALNMLESILVRKTVSEEEAAEMRAEWDRAKKILMAHMDVPSHSSSLIPVEKE